MYDTSGAIRRNRFYMGDGWKRYVQLFEGGEEKLAIPGDRVDESGTYVAYRNVIYRVDQSSDDGQTPFEICFTFNYRSS